MECHPNLERFFKENRNIVGMEISCVQNIPKQPNDQINDHSRILNWRYLPYIRPIVEAYVREYPDKIWPYMVQYLHFRILKFPLK